MGHSWGASPLWLAVGGCGRAVSVQVLAEAANLAALHDQLQLLLQACYTDSLFLNDTVFLGHDGCSFRIYIIIRYIIVRRLL